jgi:hypothetical protein
MKHQDYCSKQGSIIITALNAVGERVRLPDALKARDQRYSCPGCGVPMYPEGATKVLAGNYARRGHFNVLPTYSPDLIHQLKAPASMSDLARTVMVERLEHSANFDYVAANVPYENHKTKKNLDTGEREAWKEKGFNLDVLARKMGADAQDIVLHIVELSRLQRARDLYSRLKDLATEYTDKRRFAVESDGKRIPLESRVYQGIVLIRDHDSFQPLERRVRLVPTVYDFIAAFTPEITYFDPSSESLKVSKISDPEVDGEANQDDPSRLFKVSDRALLYFTFEGQERGQLVRKLRNRTGANGINIRNWKAAVPKEIEVDLEGNPTQKRAAQFSLNLNP